MFTTWLKMSLVSCLAFLLPIKPLIIGVMIVTVIDLITGIMAAKKRGEKIRSAGLVRTVTKTFLYNMAILAGHVSGMMILEDAQWVAKAVAVAITSFELKSVLENVTTVLGQPIFKLLMDKLGSKNDPRKEKGNTSGE